MQKKINSNVKTAKRSVPVVFSMVFESIFSKKEKCFKEIENRLFHCRGIEC